MSTEVLELGQDRVATSIMDLASGIFAAKTASGLFYNLRKALSDDPSMAPAQILARIGEVQN